MTTEEIARKYGVPMPEICEKLDWKNDTVFNWYKNYYGTLIVMTFIEASSSIRRYGEGYVKFICKAPQFHEFISKHNEDSFFQYMLESIVKSYIDNNQPSKDVIKNSYNL